MALAQEIFAIAPAHGVAGLSGAQSRLLTGRALWLRAAYERGLAVVPTVCLTRAAWDGLQAERRTGSNSLRKHWIATLYRLVGTAGSPPALVVRTAAPGPAAGLMPAQTGIAAPRQELESVDTLRPLGRAIKQAFHSYDVAATAGTPVSDAERARQFVLVQAMAEGRLLRFTTRDEVTGEMGPVPDAGEPATPLPPESQAIAEALDAVAGQHLSCLVAISGGRASLVSVRPVPVSAPAELEAAVDRAERGVWTPSQAVAAIDPGRLPQLLHPRLRSDTAGQPIATGLGVSPGAASGVIVFTPEDAARTRARGRHCILVVTETGPTDIEGMKAATGILTARGGMTSHAAVVARITGKPCVAALRDLQIDVTEASCRIGGRVLRAGDRLTIDGSDGNVYAGALPLSQPHIGGAIATLLGWSDSSRTIKVRTNAETLEAARTALSFGAEGIGLARSEHMFFSPERMLALRRLILSADETDRRQALVGLVDYQTEDYSALFTALGARPVTVRLFDPPLHEFLPRSDEGIEETAAALGLGVKALRLRLDRLAEVNPMLGHRGVRLAITYPEILDMQMQAMISGVKAAMQRQAEPVTLEVMVPFVSTASEVATIRERVFAVVERAGLPPEARERFAFGTMIELPRAVLRAGEIARHVDFFSFGTNDLTQTTYGISRDDAPAFLAVYQRENLYEHDPFVSLDVKGVGEMIEIAIARGRAANPRLRIGICGEHAGDPASLDFFAGLGVDYVSCAPYRVPVARLALAQAAEAETENLPRIRRV